MARGEYTSIGTDRYRAGGTQWWQQPTWRQTTWQQPRPWWQQPAYQGSVQSQYPGFQWVPGYGNVSGHWERVHAPYGGNW
jgi:hypothetical protein